MKFTVKVKDFYLDEENLESALVDKIQREVVSQIHKSIKDRVERQIEMEVKSMVEKTMYKQITSEIENILKTGKTKSKKNSKEDVSLEEYVRECFSSTGGWQNFDETIKVISKKFGEELKQRYDLLFASQIVAKLNDNGLLKDDVAKLILDK